MQVSSRIRRLKEFISHFQQKYQPPRPPAVPQEGGPILRISKMQDILRWYITRYEPVCYWCNKLIPDSGFSTFKNERDPFTIHHVDEDRDNNDISNLEIIHRDCHQQMHKLSTAIRLPALAVRAIYHGNIGSFA